MPRIASALSFLASGTLIGCGEGVLVDSPVPADQRAPRRRPDPARGQASLCGTRERRAAQKKGTTFQTTLVAYFLQPRQEDATSSEHADVGRQVKIGTPQAEKKSITLKAGAGFGRLRWGVSLRFAPGPFELNQTGGEVTVQVGGKTLSGKFRGPPRLVQARS